MIDGRYCDSFKIDTLQCDAVAGVNQLCFVWRTGNPFSGKDITISLEFSGMCQHHWAHYFPLLNPRSSEAVPLPLQT